MIKNMIKVKGPDDIPKGRHYAVIVFSKQVVNHPEEGVWAPGHGYPAYTEEIPTFEYYVTEDKQLWEEFIQVGSFKAHKFDPYKPYVALVVEAKAVVTTKTVVEVK